MTFTIHLGSMFLGIVVGMVLEIFIMASASVGGDGEGY